MNDRADEVTSAEMLTRLHSRSDFLKMVGAAGLGAAVGSNLFLREALALGPTGPTDPSFSFEKISDYSAFSVLSDNFVEHSDGFDANQGLYKILAPAPERRRGGVTIDDGVVRIAGSPFFALLQTNKAPVAPYAAVIVDVRSFIRSARTHNSVYAGLIRDDQNYVMAWYNNTTKMAGFDVVIDGKVNRLAETPATLATPVRFAFVLNSKEITALADTGGGSFGGWKPVANYPNGPTEFNGRQYPDPATAPGLSGYVDLRDPNVLGQYKYGFGARGDTGTIVLDNVEAGYWGRAAVRDPHVVTCADGTPYIEGNKLYFTLTNAGLDFFSTAHWGVYTLDLSNYASPEALEEVGKIFFKRQQSDPENKSVKVFGDHAGHIVCDDVAGEFIVGASTWGDFTYRGLQINYTRTSTNVLSGVHLLDVQKLNLPVVRGVTYRDRGNWDPHFVRVADEWYVAFVDSPSQGGSDWWHYPALAKGPTLDGPLELVGAQSDLNQTEGVVIQKIGDQWYLLCSSGRDELGDEDAGSATYRIYLLQRDEEPSELGGPELKFFGELNAEYVTNIPHPMVTPLPLNGGTKWIMLTFNGTDFYGWDPDGKPILDYGTHGNFIVMDGPIWDGYYEFEP